MKETKQLGEIPSVLMAIHQVKLHFCYEQVVSEEQEIEFFFKVFKQDKFKLEFVLLKDV